VKKLSGPMEDMIKGAEVHETRINGKIVRRGYMVAGRSNTIVALIDRGLITTSDAGNHGINWLTESGLVVLHDLTGVEVPGMDDMPVFLPNGFRDVPMSEDHPADSCNDCESGQTCPEHCTHRGGTNSTPCPRHDVASEDHPADSGMITDAPVEVRDWVHVAHSVPMEAGDFDRMNADAERADLDSENVREFAAEREEAMDDWHERNSVVDYINTELDAAMIFVEAMSDDRLMTLTSKGVFVSRAYINVMSRIAAMSADRMQLWRAHQADVIRETPNLFALLDAMHREGTITFGKADKEKRKIRNTCRPCLGVKRKPSKHHR
jgi:hypothetical protein